METAIIFWKVFRLKKLEAIAKIRDKENKILFTSFLILEWSLQN
jgi:hypothetical protein